MLRSVTCSTQLKPMVCVSNFRDDVTMSTRIALKFIGQSPTLKFNIHWLNLTSLHWTTTNMICFHSQIQINRSWEIKNHSPSLSHALLQNDDPWFWMPISLWISYGTPFHPAVCMINFLLLWYEGKSHIAHANSFSFNAMESSLYDSNK